MLKLAAASGSRQSDEHCDIICRQSHMLVPPQVTLVLWHLEHPDQQTDEEVAQLSASAVIRTLGGLSANFCIPPVLVVGHCLTEQPGSGHSRHLQRIDSNLNDVSNIRSFSDAM